MSEVSDLARQLSRQADEIGETYNQTAIIPLRTYYYLSALSDYLHIPRSRLAGQLLRAAIHDAIGALPVDGDWSADGHDFATPHEYFAYQAWSRESDENMLGEFLARRAEQENGALPVQGGE